LAVFWVALTGTVVSLQAAFQALLTFNWDVQMAVDKILNAHEAML
jgi:hypothetical protein